MTRIAQSLSNSNQLRTRLLDNNTTTRRRREKNVFEQLPLSNEDNSSGPMNILMNYLEIKDLGRLGSTCQFFKNIVADEKFYEKYIDKNHPQFNDVIRYNLNNYMNVYFKYPHLRKPVFQLKYIDKSLKCAVNKRMISIDHLHSITNKERFILERFFSNDHKRNELIFKILLPVSFACSIAIIASPALNNFTFSCLISTITVFICYATAMFYFYRIIPELDFRKKVIEYYNLGAEVW